MKNREQFTEFLNQKGYAEKSSKQILKFIDYFEEWAAEQNIDPDRITYNELMLYIANLHEKSNKINTIAQKVRGIESYLYFIGRSDNPAKAIKLKGSLRKVPQHILDDSELMDIYNLQHTNGLIGKRDKVMLSLVIFQGVIGRELEVIELKDVDLQNCKIYIPSTRSTNSRVLDLKPLQLLLFQDYITKIRGEILQQTNRQSDKFLVTMGSSPNNNERLQNVLNTIRDRLKPHYPAFKSMTQIRQSLVTQWINQYGLRHAQYMSGHRYVSSTERYRQDKDEGLKNELNKHFSID